MNNPERLKVAIVTKAIEDWRKLIKLGTDRLNSSPVVTFTELRNFFQGDFCHSLMATMKYTPEEILVRLERELAAAERDKLQKDVSL